MKWGLSYLRFIVLSIYVLLRGGVLTDTAEDIHEYTYRLTESPASISQPRLISAFATETCPCSAARCKAEYPNCVNLHVDPCMDVDAVNTYMYEAS